VKPRFQADADLRSEIVSGVLRREPAIDFQSAQDQLEDGTADPLVLRIAAPEGRILVSHDVGTMPGHLRRFMAEGGRSPGVLLIPQVVTTAEAIEELVMIWAVSEAAEWENLVVWLPL
jgi:hypothetical protein